MTDFTIRNAEKSDAALILDFIRELAVYEKLEQDVVATVAALEKTLFGEAPKAFCLIAEADGRPAAFASCCYNYSTFQAKPGLYLEDLFVRPEFRGQGLGKAFFQYLAQRAVAENCGRVQWSVLNWNEPAIAFYKSMKAAPLDEWTVYRLEGQAINDLAQGEKQQPANVKAA